MEPKYKVVYGEDGKLNCWNKDKQGMYMVEIDEGMAGGFASILLTDSQLKDFLSTLQNLFDKGNPNLTVP